MKTLFAPAALTVGTSRTTIDELAAAIVEPNKIPVS
jgi:hypothetical protein